LTKIMKFVKECWVPTPRNQKMYKLTNETGLDFTNLQDILKKFIPYSQKSLGWRKPVSLFLKSDQENANKILGKTAHYDPESFCVTVFVDGRHPKDILRSLSHELVHHSQNCRGEFKDGVVASEGYAQKDSHMRGMELEAYEKGNIIFRDFEDLIKAGKINVTLTGEPKMSLKEWKNNELNTLLMKKWGLGGLQESWGDRPAYRGEDEDCAGGVDPETGRCIDELPGKGSLHFKESSDLEEGHEHGPECGCPDQDDPADPQMITMREAKELARKIFTRINKEI